MPDYQNIAKTLLFNSKDFTLEKFGVTYRKGKILDDIVKAKEKAFYNRKDSNIKEEVELLALYLKDVFKQAKGV